MSAHLKHLRYVLIHKWFVFIYCLEYGLIWRGIKHDWTKFLPSEWFPYVDFFYRGEPSSRTGAAQPKKATPEFEVAVNHHLHRNDHHWAYWVRLGDDGTVLALPMPDKCRKEMMADWLGVAAILPVISIGRMIFLTRTINHPAGKGFSPAPLKSRD